MIMLRMQKTLSNKEFNTELDFFFYPKWEMGKILFREFIFIFLLWKIYRIIFKVILETLPSINALKASPGSWSGFQINPIQRTSYLKALGTNSKSLCPMLSNKDEIQQIREKSGSKELFPDDESNLGH